MRKAANISMNKLFHECGLDSRAPNEFVIPQETLKKLIEAFGLRNTLRWINGDEITDAHLAAHEL